MGITASNPIQQRIDLLAEKWNDTVADDPAPVVRIHAQRNEEDMVDTFFWYMLGEDTPVEDIAVIFDSLFMDIQTYSRQLLKELETVVDQWNHIPKSEEVEFIGIDWEPDYELGDRNNPAALFVRNFNRLAAQLDLEDEYYTVAVIKTTVLNNRRFAEWMEYAIKAGISDRVKFLISDTNEHPLFDKLAHDYKEQVVTIVPGLDMANAMAQIAAMGNPAEPATPYRQAFVKMMAAMEQRKEQETLRYGKECIRIAEKHLGHDPYWITQLVVVYSALSNDQLGYKKMDKALAYADDALGIATQSQEVLEQELAYKLMGQALMYKGSLLCMQKKWNDAMACFSTAADRYTVVEDFILGVEAFRMTGFSGKKAGENKAAVQALAEGLRFSAGLDPKIAGGTTLAGLIELLLDSHYEPVVTYREIDDIASHFYGKDWPEVIRDWKTLPQEVQEELVS